MKKLKLSSFMLLMFSLVFAFASCGGDDEEDSGSEGHSGQQCGENVYWKYNSNSGELVISGSGYMFDFYENGQPWLYEDVRRVTIESGVKSIGENAFRGSSISRITIPSTVEVIGSYAFADCESLESFYIKDGSKLRGIEEYAFFDCPIYMNTFTFPKHLEYIGDKAFYGAEVRNLEINKGFREIGDQVFNGLQGSLYLPNSVESVGTYAFCGSISEIHIGARMSRLSSGAFKSTRSSGSMYVNQKYPISLQGSGSVMADGDDYWTLYVPKGSKSAYSKQSPWKYFRNIYEDSSLDGRDDTNDNNGGDDNGGNDNGGNTKHEYVDLGLPSGIKWATCNVGASSPEDYGDYFAWGETRPKSSYDEGNSKTYGKQMSDISGNSRYDAACYNWGGTWRMPTRTEMEELENKCTWEWTSQKGVNGRLVTGPNGNSIFLPAAGYRNGTSLVQAGEWGYFWSSTPNEACGFAYGHDFNAIGYNWDDWYYRYYGHSVRPVSD